MGKKLSVREHLKASLLGLPNIKVAGVKPTITINSDFTFPYFIHAGVIIVIQETVSGSPFQ